MVGVLSFPLVHCCGRFVVKNQKATEAVADQTLDYLDYVFFSGRNYTR